MQKLFDRISIFFIMIRNVEFKIFNKKQLDWSISTRIYEKLDIQELG